GRGAFLQVAEVRQGIGAPNNLAWLVARHPLSVVMPIVLSGARVPAERLLALGIAHEVVADDDCRARARALAGDIAGFPPGAGRTMKAAVLELAGVADVETWFDRAAAASPRPPGTGFRPRRVD
ncbi:MAG: enoyl-CoA hydratase/isomerase family protein, partial [Acidimicrobiales bacterium]